MCTLLMAIALTAPLLGSSMPQQTSPGSEKLDLNSASIQQLVMLPGMGHEYARRVIAGRPYTAKNQLVTRGILPADEYGRISALVIAHRPKPAVEK
ncbi:MAG: helix-hairpin-helix domain-containing protein [Acidobacteriaceae bacterium]|nr:helix-hairpin-helix domain-containing protein [Acidobacteriaceae bacterium]